MGYFWGLQYLKWPLGGTWGLEWYFKKKLQPSGNRKCRTGINTHKTKEEETQKTSTQLVISLRERTPTVSNVIPL